MPEWGGGVKSGRYRPVFALAASFFLPKPPYYPLIQSAASSADASRSHPEERPWYPETSAADSASFPSFDDPLASPLDPPTTPPAP